LGFGLAGINKINSYYLAFTLLHLARSMLLKNFYQSASYTRAALYSAFSSPGCGITWTIVTFLSGVLYLIYNEHKRHNVGTALKEGVAYLENSCEAPTHNDTPGITIQSSRTIG